MGRSLGTGVATYLATKRVASKVILSTPFDSLENVAKEMYPIIPIKQILRHKFDSIGRAPYIKLPVLILAASKDTVIPPWHAKELASKWRGNVTFHEFEGFDHHTINQSQNYWKYIEDFSTNKRAKT